MVLLWAYHSGIFPAGGPMMVVIGALLTLLGLGGAAAAQPQRPQWTLDQYNQWRLGHGLPLMTVDEWNKRRGLEGAYNPATDPAALPPARRDTPPPSPLVPSDTPTGRLGGAR